jgi:aspartyl-tRNA(Asn)/glutamyl-tRNA(Gln) amidotransferase subunit A
VKLHELTAAQAAFQIRSRVISSTEFVQALLARVRETDGEIQAWETLVAERALSRARRADAVMRRGGQLGILHGVAFAAKDIIATAGVRTACGFGPFDHRIPARNADVIAGLQREGAILLGKTVTTQFAWAQPSRTRNPWALDRTPGGSSSGSAAAVAARQVPLALGSQTAGSTLRPAAYNGVVGFKPSMGRVSTRGLFPLAKTLDHVGCIARSVEDCALFLRAADSQPHRPSTIPGDQERPPTLGLLREAVDRSSPFVAAHLETLAKKFSKEGSDVREIALEVPLATAIPAHRITINYEAALLHRRLMKTYPATAYAPKTLEYIAAGSRISRAAYLQAQIERQRFIACLGSYLSSVDALILPTVVDVAPPGLDTTGEPSLQTPFTFAGVPAISLPSDLSPEGLPVGLQLVGRLADDEHLLMVAQWCERQLPPLHAPS